MGTDCPVVTDGGTSPTNDGRCDLSHEEFDQVRENLVRYAGGGGEQARVDQFLADYNRIKSIPGSARVLKQMEATVDQVDGELQVARIAASTDRDIKELEKELGPKGANGEIDIEYADGTLGESKAVDASDFRPENDRNVFEIANQIAKWETQGGIDLEGRTVVIYVKTKPNQEAGVVESIEDYIEENTDSDVSIDFKEVPPTE